MWSLALPDTTDAIAELELAFTPSRGPKKYELTDAERKAVLAHYTAYDAAAGVAGPNLAAPMGVSAALLAAIHDAYDEVQDGKRLQPLRGRLKLGVRRCPFCGIGPVTDLDHHLPRSGYKGVSIHARNLVPSCGTCNNKKRAHTGGAPAELWLHAYFDELPDVRFFRAVASLVGAALRVDFYIDKTVGLDPIVASRLDFQIGKLALNDRYQAEITLLLEPMAVSLMEFAAAPADKLVVRDYFERTARQTERKHGKNDWRVATLDALTECDPFCDGGFIDALGLRAATASAA